MEMTLMTFQKLRPVLNHVLTIGQDLFSIKKIRNGDVEIPFFPNSPFDELRVIGLVGLVYKVNE
jgi:hypothetical protein